jgi:predicted alpha/beta hydrolase family esterase
MNAIILHGRSDKEDYYEPTFPSSSNAHWLPWLQKQLIVSDIAAQTPDVPLSYEPKYEIWCREFERQDIGPDTILVGHSCGGGFLVRWLSEHKDIKVASVVLVAPWLDPLNELKDDFFDFEIDSELPIEPRNWSF